MAHPLIVVGYDGSAAAELALDWALAVASVERARLAVLIAVSTMDPVHSEFHEASQRRAQECRVSAEAGLRRRFAETPGLRASVVAAVQISQGPPATVLLRSVQPSDLLVVGAPGHRRLVADLTGSVSQSVAQHARCPAVVVRPVSAEARGIVVGVDGSESSLDGLRWACRLAQLMGQPVTAVHASHSLTPGAHAAASAQLARWVDRVRDAHAGVEITTSAVAGDATHVLTELSRSAVLVVLGSGGRDTLPGMLLGSTTQRVLGRAECPVAVVHPALRS